MGSLAARRCGATSGRGGAALKKAAPGGRGLLGEMFGEPRESRLVRRQFVKPVRACHFPFPLYDIRIEFEGF